MFSGSIASSSASSCSSSVMSGIGDPPWRDAPRGRAGSLHQQVPVREVDRLQLAQRLADLRGPDVPDPLDRLYFRVGRGKHLVEASEDLDDVADDKLRQPGNASQDPEAPRRDGVVKRVDLAIEAEQLGEAPEVQKVLVG